MPITHAPPVAKARSLTDVYEAVSGSAMSGQSACFVDVRGITSTIEGRECLTIPVSHKGSFYCSCGAEHLWQAAADLVRLLPGVGTLVVTYRITAESCDAVADGVSQ